MKFIMKNYTNKSICLIIKIFNDFVASGSQKGEINVSRFCETIGISLRDFIIDIDFIIEDLITASIYNEGCGYTLLDNIQFNEITIKYNVSNCLKKDVHHKQVVYDIKSILKLNNKYDIQLYMAFLNNDKKCFTITGLKSIYDAQYGYSNDSDFVTKKVKPSIENINRVTDIKVTYFRKKTNEDKYYFDFIQSED